MNRSRPPVCRFSLKVPKTGPSALNRLVTMPEIPTGRG